MKKLLAVVAVLGILGTGLQAEVLTVQSPGGLKNMDVDNPSVFTLETHASPIKITSIWMAADDGDSLNDPVGESVSAVLTGGSKAMNASYGVASADTAWLTDVAVPEFAGTKADGQVKWTATEIDVDDLTLDAGTTYTFNVVPVNDTGKLVQTFSTTSDPVVVTDGEGASLLTFQSNDDRTALWQIGFEVVPEPATMAMLGLGGLVALRRRRR